MAKQNKTKPRYQDDDYSVIEEVYQKFMVFKNVSLTKKQEEFHQTILKNKITVATGYAGTSKTFTACYTCLQALKEKTFSKIILCKPTEIVGDSEIGFLKGTLEEKLAVYKESFVSNFNEIIDEKDVKMLFDSNKIEFKPVNFIRGTTMKDSIIIIDEFQNFDINQLMAIVTRLGKNSKMVFIGDVRQSDINKKYLAVNVFKKVLEGINSIQMFEFDKTDIIREPILIEIMEKYEQMELAGEIGISKTKQ